MAQFLDAGVLREAQGRFRERWLCGGFTQCQWGQAADNDDDDSDAALSGSDSDDDGVGARPREPYWTTFDLHHTACFPNSPSMRCAIRNNAFRLNERCRLGATALHYAVAHRRYNNVRLLMQAKADPNAEWISRTIRTDSLTPLQLACTMGSNKAIRVLMDQGKPALRLFLRHSPLPRDVNRYICNLTKDRSLERPDVNALGGHNGTENPMTLLINSPDAMYPEDGVKFLLRCGARTWVPGMRWYASTAAQRRARTFHPGSRVRMRLESLAKELKCEELKQCRRVKRKHKKSSVTPQDVGRPRTHRQRWG